MVISLNSLKEIWESITLPYISIYYNLQSVHFEFQLVLNQSSTLLSPVSYLMWRHKNICELGLSMVFCYVIWVMFCV